MHIGDSKLDVLSLRDIDWSPSQMEADLDRTWLDTFGATRCVLTISTRNHMEIERNWRDSALLNGLHHFIWYGVSQSVSAHYF